MLIIQIPAVFKWLKLVFERHLKNSLFQSGYWVLFNDQDNFLPFMSGGQHRSLVAHWLWKDGGKSQGWFQIYLNSIINDPLIYQVY